MKGLKLILILSFSLLPLSAQTQVGNDEAKSSYQTAPLDQLFQQAIDDHEIPAAALQLIHQGEIVYDKAFGWKNIEKGEALKQSDLFRIASMTKAVTAVAIMQLCEKGQLSVEDPLSLYFPEFEKMEIMGASDANDPLTSHPAQYEITIRHLLTHTSGMAYGYENEAYNALMVKKGISEGFEERPIHNIPNTQKIAELPLLHEPGAQWTYGVSYDVLGALIEVISGQPLDQYFHEHIFKPLGMKDTCFHPPEDQADRLVAVYEYNKDKTGFIPATYPLCHYPVRGAKTYMSGGADLVSTTKDIGIFAQALLNKGKYKGTRILSEATVERMSERQSDHGWPNSDVGFGLYTLTEAGAENNTRTEGSYDFGGFFDTWCWVDPKSDLIGIIFLQMYPNNDYKLGSRFQDLSYKVIGAP